MRPTLAIDTSGPVACVCFHDGSDSWQELQGDGENSHNEQLPVLTRSVLPLGVSVERILVGAGPGSFTGLRIGFGFAKGLAFARSAQLESVPSMLAMAASCPPDLRLIAAVRNAGRGEYFMSTCCCTGHGREYEAAALRTESEIIATLEQYQSTYRIACKSVAIVTDTPETLEAGRDVFGRAVIRPINLARSLIMLGDSGIAIENPETTAAGGASALSELSPIYVREVAARTLDERRSGLRISK